MLFRSIGFALRNHVGDIVELGSQKVRVDSALKAEALALSLAVKTARKLNLSLIEIEGDNLCLINVLNGIWSCPWEINMIVNDILFDFRFFAGVRCAHVFRELNQVADRLAKIGLGSQLSAWNEDKELHVLVRKDALGCRYNRL